MSIYLPIAEISVNAFIILGMGAAVGFLSGMFGVGGGFLITPLLIFYNIPLSLLRPVQIRSLLHPSPGPCRISGVALWISSWA